MSTLVNIVINLLMAGFGFPQEEMKDTMPPANEISVECLIEIQEENTYQC